MALELRRYGACEGYHRWRTTPSVSTSTGITLTPAKLSLGNCTLRVPFLFSGGSGSYSVFTTNNFHAPVTSALPLGDNRHYFFLNLQYPPRPFDAEGDRVQPATLTVVDTQGRTATAEVITTISPGVTCPDNPLFTVSPESANFRGEILAFQVSAQPVAVEFSDPG